MSTSGKAFNPNCTRCPRLKRHLKATAKQYPSYHCKPVPAFGDKKATLLIVGLAPGLHGANATGQAFTGDASGDLLFQTLYELGLSNQAQARTLNNKLRLKNCRITNAVKCYPPENKPIGAEIKNCSPYLKTEIANMPNQAVILALGKIAHDSVLGALGLVKKHYRFGHNAVHSLNCALDCASATKGDAKPQKQYQLVDSYHCSRYNLTTKRLTPDMFKAAVLTASELMQL